MTIGVIRGDEGMGDVPGVQGGSGGACNGHYNRTPDLGKCRMWWNTWDLAKRTILDAKVLDRNVTWLTKHKDTLDTSTRCEDT